MMFVISTIGFGQNGQYDVRLNLNSYDCNSLELLVDIDVRASSSNTTFRIAEQNYRFSFNTDAIDSVSIVEEGVISGFSAPSGGDLGFPLYMPHNLGGTLDNEISYNIELTLGDGVLIETEWVHVGTLAFSISDIDASLDLNWYAQSNFPPTFISEKYEDTLFSVVEGVYINDVGINTFGEICNPDCPSGDIVLTSDWNVNNFLNDYPNCTELTGSLTVQSDSFDEYSGFWDLSFLSQITSVAGNLNIYNNNYYVFSLGGLDNLTFVGGDLNIGGNANLYGLGGLGNLSTVNGRLNIDGNSSLSTLEGLQNLTTIGDLKITSNHGLSICNTPFICNYLANNNSYEISNNNIGCSTAEEVSAHCSPMPPVCPPGDIGVTSEAELYSIFSLYPNCTEIAGNLYVNIEDIFDFANFNALNQITVIEGNLSLIGLGVHKATGLSNLTSIGGDLKIANTYMQSLEGLENLTSIDGSLIITNNIHSFVDITGIGNIDYTTINGLEIYDNSDLVVCNLPNICNYLGNGGAATISNNSYDPAGCNNNSEAIQSCFLPVEISTPLQAHLQNQTARLTWRTETETHNAGFEIQRSQDGVQWQRIAWQVGQGTTTTPQTYTHTDENPLSGTSYYRLKQVDFDGNFSYSNIADLYYERNTPINIYPNPVQDILHINTEYAIQEAIIFDTTGRTTKAQMTNNTINVSTLPKGIYTLKITVESGSFYEKILVK